MSTELFVLDGKWRVCSNSGISKICENVLDVLDFQGGEQLLIRIGRTQNDGGRNVDEEFDALEILNQLSVHRPRSVSVGRGAFVRTSLRFFILVSLPEKMATDVVEECQPILLLNCGANAMHTTIIITASQKIMPAITLRHLSTSICSCHHPPPGRVDWCAFSSGSAVRGT